jgi:hypothetical protein
MIAPSRRQRLTPRRQRVHRRDRADSAPGRQGVKPFATWDETVTFTKQTATDRTVLMERVDGTGARRGRGSQSRKGRVCTTRRPRSADVEQPRVPDTRRKAVVWSVDEPSRVAFQQLKMPDVGYVDGMSVPNYENRDPARSISCRSKSTTR